MGEKKQAYNNVFTLLGAALMMRIGGMLRVVMPSVDHLTAKDSLQCSEGHELRLEHMQASAPLSSTRLEVLELYEERKFDSHRLWAGHLADCKQCQRALTPRIRRFCSEMLLGHREPPQLSQLPCRATEPADVRHDAYHMSLRTRDCHGTGDIGRIAY